MSARRLPVAVRVGREYHESVIAEREAIQRRSKVEELLKRQLQQVTGTILVASYTFGSTGIWQEAIHSTYGREQRAGFSTRYTFEEPAIRQAAHIAIRAVQDDVLVVSLVKPDFVPSFIGEVVNYPDFELLEVTADQVARA